jgi:hypothetical protein
VTRRHAADLGGEFPFRKPLRQCRLTGDPLAQIGVRWCHPFLAGAELEAQIAVSDRGSLRGLTQFARSASVERVEPAESKRVVRKHTRGTGVCDNLSLPAATR